MTCEKREDGLITPLLPVVSRTTIDAALHSFTEQNLMNAWGSTLPLFVWLAKHGTAFFYGGAFCRYVLEQTAKPKKLAPITQKTMDEFEKELKDRQNKLLQLKITDIRQVPVELAPSFAVWKPENPDLMNFLALNMPGGLAMGGFTPPEIGLAQAGALLTYEISRMQAAKPG